MKISYATVLFSAIICMSCNAGEIFVSKKYGFFAQFPARPDANTLKSGLGDNLAVAAAVVEEEPPKVLFFQIMAGNVAGMKVMPEFGREENLNLAKKNLEAFLTEGKCTNAKIWESGVSSWPAIEFSCKQDGLFKVGVTSFKRGYAFLIKDTYYKVMVSSLEDNKELKDQALKFFAGFSFADAKTIEQMANTLKTEE
jgi:hypothetical protein